MRESDRDRFGLRAVFATVYTGERVTPPSHLAPFVSEATDGTITEPVLNVGVLVGPDRDALVRDFTTWRATWARTVHLGARRELATLATLLPPAMARRLSAAELTPVEVAGLAGTIEQVLADTESLPLCLVNLQSNRVAMVLDAGENQPLPATLSVAGHVLRVEPNEDPEDAVAGWQLSGEGVSWRTLAGQTHQASEHLADALSALLPGTAAVQVRSVRASAAFARTVHALQEVARAAAGRGPVHLHGPLR